MQYTDGWAKDDLIYKWKEKDPVQVVPGLHLPRFTLEQYKSAYCDVITNTGKIRKISKLIWVLLSNFQVILMIYLLYVISILGEYSCLKVELIFKREFSYYLITIYVPCCMLVIVSWVSFWLDQNAIPARVSLGVTTLLTMSTQVSNSENIWSKVLSWSLQQNNFGKYLPYLISIKKSIFNHFIFKIDYYDITFDTFQTSGINAQLPPVSYTKAIDVWTGVRIIKCFIDIDLITKNLIFL